MIINLLHVDILGLLRSGWILISDLLHGALGRLIFLITSGGSLNGDARLFTSGFGKGAAVLDRPKIKLRMGMSSK